jgi:hypothetical protein
MSVRTRIHFLEFFTYYIELPLCGFPRYNGRTDVRRFLIGFWINCSRETSRRRYIQTEHPSSNAIPTASVLRNNRSPFSSPNVTSLVPVRVLATPTGHWEFCSWGWADRQDGVEAGEDTEDRHMLAHVKLHAAHYTWDFSYSLHPLGNRWRTQNSIVSPQSYIHHW